MERRRSTTFARVKSTVKEGLIGNTYRITGLAIILK